MLNINTHNSLRTKSIIKKLTQPISVGLKNNTIGSTNIRMTKNPLEKPKKISSTELIITPKFFYV